jgi:glycosyltransferase involved in cell wall biosynthesis
MKIVLPQPLQSLAETELILYMPRNCVAVIPAHNEDRFIASVVLKTLHHASLVIVVDDGSTDQTAFLAHQAGALVIKSDINLGKAKAINLGFIEALKHNPEVIVCLDGDSQHEPAEIPDLIQPILNGEADIVVGSRFLNSSDNTPNWRKFGQWLFTKITNAASKVKITDSQSGFRAFSVGAVRSLRFSSSSLGFESEMQILLNDHQYRVTEVPITVHYIDGNKRSPFSHGLQVIDTIMGLIARRRPLAFFSLPGVVIASIGVFFGINVLHEIITQKTIAFGTALVASSFLVIGVLLFATGVILNSLGSFFQKTEEKIIQTIQQKDKKT